MAAMRVGPSYTRQDRPVHRQELTRVLPEHSLLCGLRQLALPLCFLCPVLLPLKKATADKERAHTQ